MSSKRERRKRERRRRRSTVRSAAPNSTPDAAVKLAEAVAEKTGNLVRDYLRREDLAAKVFELADCTRDLALQAMQQSPLNGRHECRAGCAFCCHTAVTVAPIEVFAIVRHLQGHYSHEELSHVRQHLDENATLASKMARDEYIARLIPCALMTEDGNCRAHPVRPLACAGFLSTSRARCEAEFKRVPGRDPVPTDRFTMVAGLAVSKGLSNACREADLEGGFYELHSALRRVLETPDAVEQWARGVNVLDGCLR